jgi:hypothetical protein
MTAFVEVSALDEEFYSGSLVIIIEILEKFCPKWRNVNQRAESIYKLFLSFLLKM